MPDKVKLQERYGRSEGGLYEVEDTIGVPHPYCIGPRHVAIAAEQFNGMLGEAAIQAAEKQGVHCCMGRCTLTYKQHEQALLVACHGPLKDDDGVAMPELHAYLLKCKPLCEADGYVGFAFREVK